MRVRSFLPCLTGEVSSPVFPMRLTSEPCHAKCQWDGDEFFPLPWERVASRPQSITLSARDQRRRHGDTQCIGGLEIDRELELARLFDRNIGDFDALSLTTKQASSSSSIVHGGGKRRGEGITKISRR